MIAVWRSCLNISLPPPWGTSKNHPSTSNHAAQSRKTLPAAEPAELAALQISKSVGPSPERVFGPKPRSKAVRFKNCPRSFCLYRATGHLHEVIMVILQQKSRLGFKYNFNPEGLHAQLCALYPPEGKISKVCSVNQIEIEIDIKCCQKNTHNVQGQKFELLNFSNIQTIQTVWMIWMISLDWMFLVFGTLKNQRSVF